MAVKKKRRSDSGEVSRFDVESYFNKNKTKTRNALAKAKEDEDGFPQYDDGRYRFRLLKVEANKSNNGRPQIVTYYKFLDGDYKGKEYRAYRGIENEDNIHYFLNDVKRLGYEIDELEPSEIPALLKQMGKDKPVIVAMLKTKEGKDGNDYQNLLINRVVGDDEDEDDEEDDDEPKKKKKKSTARDEDEDEDDDDDSSDDDEEEDDEPKKKKGKKKSTRDEDEEDDEESDDEDDDEPPKKGKKKRSTDDEDDDEEEAEEDEDEDDDEESVPVTVGSVVKVKLKSGTVKAEVVDVLEDDNAIKIKTKDGKTIRVSAEKILSVEEPPKKKKTKK